MAKVKTKPAPEHQPLSVGRHNGEHIWGYEVQMDGIVRLSPMFADRMRTVHDREVGLTEMQTQIARFVAAELARTSKEKREWWDELFEDLGLNGAPSWTVNIADGTVRPTPPKPLAADDAGQLPDRSL